MDHFDQNNILCDEQHGFRTKRSCESQLVITIHEIAKNMEDGDQTDIILLDFAKAFDKVPNARLLRKMDYYGLKSSKETNPMSTRLATPEDKVSGFGHDNGIRRQDNQSESTTHPITQYEAVHLDNLALPEYQSYNLRSQQTLISSQSISERSSQPPIIASDILPLAVNTVCDLNIENNNQNVRYEKNHGLRTSVNHLDTATGQSENVQTVTGSFVNNTRTEGLSEYDSCSDNLLVSMADQSNTYNDFYTPVVLPVINSRSDLNPEFQLAARMTSIPETDAEPYTVDSITEKAITLLDQDDEKDIIDAVILHAEDDRQLALEFIENMETEFPELQLNFKLFEQLHVGKGILESASLLFSSCRFVFVFVTKIFKQDYMSKVLSEVLLHDSIIVENKNSRLVPIVKDVYHDPVFAPFNPLKYNIYLESKSQNKKDILFLKTFEEFVVHGRKSHLIS